MNQIIIPKTNFLNADGTIADICERNDNYTEDISDERNQECLDIIKRKQAELEADEEYQAALDDRQKVLEAAAKKQIIFNGEALYDMVMQMQNEDPYKLGMLAGQMAKAGIIKLEE